MPKILTLILLVAPLALAQPAARETFPSDYKASPCASGEKACQSFERTKMGGVAGLRGWELQQTWVNAHWDELVTAMRPACSKLGTCFSTPGNGWLFCNEVVKNDLYSVCDRYPSDSTDHRQCFFFVRIYFVGLGLASKPAWKEMQDCGVKAASAGERTLETWMVPAAIGPDYPGSFTVYAIDSETRVPVYARVHIQSETPIYAKDVPDGLPTTFYSVPWTLKLVRVPNAEGHRDLAPPEVVVEAPGYRPVKFTLPVEIPKMTVAMDPPRSQLKPGKNTVTITAHDAATGAPVEARVMGGTRVLGRTNEPFVLELERGKTPPEIWVTSLFDTYCDIVVK